MRPTAALTLAMQARGLSVAETAALLEISEAYLGCIMARQCNISGAVAVRMEAVFGISAQKTLVDQALTELERAKMEYAKEVTG